MRRPFSCLLLLVACGKDPEASPTGATAETGADCAPLPLDGPLPAVLEGSTAGAADLSAGSCGGAGTPEVIAAFTAPDEGRYRFALSEADTSVLYALDGCAGGAELACDATELLLPLSAGEVVYLVVDGADPAFSLTAERVPDIEGVCAGGADEDLDGASDCADPDCAFDAACYELACADGLDGDGDGALDCLDADCDADPACAPACPDLAFVDGAAAGTTLGAPDHSSASCGGAGTSDVAIALVAPVAGRYVVEGTHPGVISAWSACDGEELACGAALPVLDLAAGESVVVVVDGDGAFSLTAAWHPLAEADCADGVDEDIDGRADCADRADCWSAPGCLDADHDGLSDADEASLGTDPAEWDTDGDGVSDAAEVRTLLSDPLADDASACESWESEVQPEIFILAKPIDADGDGETELLAALGEDVGSDLVLLGRDALGGWTVEQTLDPEMTVSAVADLDGDDDADVVAARVQSGDVVWYENVAGIFQAPVVVATSLGSGNLAPPADMDGDGDLDLVVTSQTYRTVTLWSNDGGGAFAAGAPIDVDGALLLPSLADVDGDGDLDVGMPKSPSGAVTWLENLGGGALADEAALLSETELQEFWRAPLIGSDVDRDGDDDLVLVYDSGVSWASNLGGAHFGARSPLIEDGSEALVADLDLDGWPDLAAAETYRWPPAITWYRSDAGTFGDALDVGGIPGDSVFEALSVVDLDDDHDPDVMAATRGGTWLFTNRISDADRDGLSQGVEACWLGTDALLADTDGGGTADGQELFDGTDPRDAADDLGPIDTDGDGASDWDEVARASTDLMDADTDGDGLPDGVELSALGTDPARADSDGDGVVDSLDAGATDADADDDGLTDGVEVALGTDPAAADTDGDGLSDGDEVAVYGSDARSADGDTDGDGILDPVEGWLGTDPLGPDSDADGVDDGAEVAASLDPLGWDTDGDELGDGAELARGTDPLVDDAAACRWPATPLANLQGASSVRAVDVDADGDLDLVWVVEAAAVADKVGWYENRGGGVWVAGPQILALSTTALAMGDVDGDGDPDLATATSTNIGWHQNLGGGAWAARVVLSTASPAPTRLVLTDLDGDGDGDIAGGSFKEDFWIEQTPTGWAREQIRAVTGSPSGMWAADLDGDADVDLLRSSTSAGLEWLDNVGGAFAARAVLFPSGATRLDAVDLDEDGDLDLAIGGTLAENLGAGAFGAWSELPPSGSGYAAFGDVDADGRVDLARLPFSDPQVLLYRNDSDLQFSELGSVPFDAGTELLLGVGAADLDGDGDADLWRWSSGALGSALVENTATDLDHDLLSEAAEGCVGLTSPALADTDGGGTHDGQELFDGTDPLDPADDAPGVDRDGDGLTDFAERAGHGSDPLRVDTDGDGLSDLDEVLADTDPAAADTDGDGASDAVELAAGTDPTDPDGDHDGLPDGGELTAGSDPSAPDTDGDGLLDGPEVLTYGSDPTVVDPDSDGDGLLDPVEVTLGTDPHGVDTDGDGLPDGAELGTDPLDPDTDGDGAPDGGELLLLTDPAVDDLGACGWPETLAVAVSQPLEALGDVDGDGLNDLVYADGTQVLYAPGLGDGTFAAPEPVLPFDAAASLVDLDQDGAPDLLWQQSYGFDAQIGWSRNLGGGAFADGVPIGDLAMALYALHAADLDGDGAVDIVANRYDFDADLRIVWYRGLGGGAFGGETVIESDLFDVNPIDVEGDGDLDLVSGAVWMENDGAGGFSEALRGIELPFFLPERVRPVDFDVDGDADLFVAVSGLAEGLYYVENLGDGGFAAPAPIPEWEFVLQLSFGFADVDLDGDPDLLASRDADDVVWVEGGGRPEKVHVVATATVGGSIRAGDLDGDGWPELVTEADGQLVAFANRLADTDGDGLPTATEECVVGTDPDLPDTDGGGALDGAELLRLTSPLDGADD